MTATTLIANNEHARLVKTVNVHYGLAKILVDQTVGFPRGVQPTLPDKEIANDWVTGRSGTCGIKSS